MSISSLGPSPQPNEAFIPNQEGSNEGENSSNSEIITSSAVSDSALLENSCRANSISLPTIVSATSSLSNLNPLQTSNQPIFHYSNSCSLLRSQSFTFGETKSSNAQGKNIMTLSQRASNHSSTASSTTNQSLASANQTLSTHTFFSTNQVNIPKETLLVTLPIVRSQSENCLTVASQKLQIPIYHSSSLVHLKALRSQQEVEHKEETASTTKPKEVKGRFSTQTEVEQEKIQSDHESRETQYESSGEKEGREQREDSSSDEDDSIKCADVDNVSEAEKTQHKPITLGKVVRDFIIFSFTESILSQIFKLRVSHLDVLRIFIEVMKICIKSRGVEQNSRLEQRLLQLNHMSKVVDSFKAQGNTVLISGIVAGVMAIVSGVAPIVGNIKGDSILGKLSMVFSGLKNMESEKFFENTSKITLAISDMSKATGQVQTAFSESHRAYDDHMKESYKMDADERTRSIEEIKDNWKNLEQFIYQSLQMQHDTARSLYQ